MTELAYPPPRLRLVTDFAGLLELVPAWEDALHQAVEAPPPTLRPEWSRSLMYRYAPEGAFRILAVFEGERLTVCFPHLRATGTRIEAACEISPALLTSRGLAGLGTLFNGLQDLYGKYKLLVRHVQRERLDAAMFLSAAQAARGAGELIRVDRNEVVRLDSAEAFPLSRLSPNGRETLRRARSRLRKAGVIASVEVHDSSPDVMRVMAEVLAIDSGSWKMSRGGALARSAHEHVQYHVALEAFAARGEARIYLLRLAGRPAAFILSFEAGSTAYFAVWSYAEAYSAWSPGWILMAEALAEASRRGVQTVDFWGRSDRFKRVWSTETVERVTLLIGLRSRILHALKLQARNLLTPALGDLERYRWKVDAPGLLQRLLRTPRRAAGQHVKSAPADHPAPNGASPDDDRDNQAPCRWR